MLEERNLSIKIHSDKIGLEGNNLIYFWNVYKSILFHILVWSINNSKNEKIIYIDIATEQVHQGLF